MSRTALYRHYDAEGRLLYVGITGDVFRKASAHASCAWTDDIARTDFERFTTWHDAEVAERAAIQLENPIHNIRRVQTPPFLGSSDGWRFAMREEIAANGDTMRRISIRAGLSNGYLHGILIDGKDPTLEKFLAVCLAIPMDPAQLIAGVSSHEDIQEKAAS